MGFALDKGIKRKADRITLIRPPMSRGKSNPKRKRM
jgi:hypothetical protein